MNVGSFNASTSAGRKLKSDIAHPGHRAVKAQWHYCMPVERACLHRWRRCPAKDRHIVTDLHPGTPVLARVGDDAVVQPVDGAAAALQSAADGSRSNLTSLAAKWKLTDEAQEELSQAVLRRTDVRVAASVLDASRARAARSLRPKVRLLPPSPPPIAIALLVCSSVRKTRSRYDLSALSRGASRRASAYPCYHLQDEQGHLRRMKSTLLHSSLGSQKDHHT